jgi:hypothetical protein
MPVSQHDVDELRREGLAMGLDGTCCVLQTTAEHLGFMIAQARALGMDETDVLDAVELVVRAVEVDKQELRSARDVLKALNYSPALIRLLTRLARAAKPPPPSWLEQRVPERHRGPLQRSFTNYTI